MGTIPASENVFPVLRMAEGAAAATPPTGEVHLYVKADGLLYWKDDAGTEYALGAVISGLADHLADATDAHDASAVSVLDTAAVFTATDVETALKELYDAIGAGGIPATIIDAAGDLIVGSAADTAVRLALGNAGANLARINGSVAWNAGTSFPTAATGDRYFRTDLGMEFYYDGTRWLSTHVMQIATHPQAAGADPGATGDVRGTLNATTSGGGGRIAMPSFLGGSNLYLVDYRVTFIVTGGTALGASHKWVGTLVGIDTNIASTGTVATVTIDSGSSNVWRTSSASIAAAVAANTLFYTSTWTKTGTPGTLTTGEVLSYRVIAT